MIVVTLIALLCSLAIPQFQLIRTRSQDTAVLGNARQLATASSQYFFSSGATAVELDQLIGATNYIKNLATVASESYPTEYSVNTPITVTGIARARTITYAP